MSKRNSSYYLGIASKNGLRITNGGSHVKIYGPAGRGFMAMPRHRDLSPGVERAIIKWFLKLGIIISLMILATWIVARAAL
jgi:hypothetical protein